MNTFNNIWTKIGGRKFVAFVLTLLVLVVLSWVGKMTNEVFWGLIGILGTFCGGNAMEHFGAALRKRAEHKPVSEGSEPSPGAEDE